MSGQLWNQGKWLNPPVSVEEKNGSLLVTSAEGSDFWRKTSYGFIHESGHALLFDFPNESAIETSFLVNYDFQFDQAGLMIWHDNANYVKAGVEFADGKPQLGAVVTIENSDWSVAPVENWMGKVVTVRASRSGDALTIRAKCEGDWQFVRVAPLDPSKTWRAGPLVSSTNRGGLIVEFKSIAFTESDSSLH
jgi:hypothetical protein